MTPGAPDLDTAATENATSLFDLIWARGIEDPAFQQVEHLKTWFKAFHCEGYKAGVKAGAGAAIALQARMQNPTATVASPAAEKPTKPIKTTKPIKAKK